MKLGFGTFKYTYKIVVTGASWWVLHRVNSSINMQGFNWLENKFKSWPRSPLATALQHLYLKIYKRRKCGTLRNLRCITVFSHNMLTKQNIALVIQHLTYSLAVLLFITQNRPLNVPKPVEVLSYAKHR